MCHQPTYNVRYWDKQEVHSSHSNPDKAKKVCRSLGHTGKTGFNPDRYEPIAFVSLVEEDGFEGVFYNPRFKVATS
jgi:hypothetical protein